MSESNVLESAQNAGAELRAQSGNIATSASESPVAIPGEAARRWRGPAGAARSHPLVQLTLARVREFVREPEAMFWVFGFPVLLAFALGIAFRNTSPEVTRVAVELDPSRATEVERIAAGLSVSPDLQAVVLRPDEAALALRTGKVALVVRTVSGTKASKTEATESSPSLDYVYDPTRPESRVARLAVDEAIQRSFGRSDVIGVADEKISEPGARYIDFLIPGLVGLNLMGSGMWGLGFAVVQARTRKLLKRLAATPMRRSHYLLSFMLSRLLFLFLEVAALIGFAWVVFKVSVRGSLLDVAIVSVVGAMTFAGLGLLVASRPKTIEGVSGWMNLVMLPMWLLSGTFFSYTRFPGFLQPFIKALPLTALNDSLRTVINEGASLSSSWQQLGVLVAWGLLSFALALRLFRWQ
jgi:ABC-2 type transport system permease protein